MSPLSSTFRQRNAVRDGSVRRRLRLLDPEQPVSAGPLWWAVLRALRPQQWVKNLLVFLPLLLSHQLSDVRRWLDLATACGLLCACASGLYLMNDLLDLEADRRHPTKRYRPLASGALPAGWGAALSGLLLIGALGGAAACMPWTFTGLLLLYAVATSAYSLYFKRVLFLDTLLLAGLYTLRVLMGGAVGAVEVSEWLRVFAMFFFISLALLKRYVELRGVARETPTEDRPFENRRGYELCDAELLETLGPVSGYLSVLVFCLYLSSPRVEALYPHAQWLWLLGPVLLYWITRLWLFARRGKLVDDPVAAALGDPASYAAGLLCVGLVVAASF